MNLFKILKMHKNDLKSLLYTKASAAGENCWLFLSTAGNVSKPCLVSHIDTVFDTEFNQLKFKTSVNMPILQDRRKSFSVYFDKSKQIVWSPDGLGADDRAGVYACLSIFFSESKNCHLLLTDGEEIGGIGAREAIKIFPLFLNTMVDYFIEIDRRGNGEMIFYNGEPLEFKKWVGEFGFEENFGSFSDISFLCGYTKKHGVNLSAGYYNQHSKAEYLNIQHLDNTIKKVKKMVNICIPKNILELKPEPKINKEVFYPLREGFGCCSNYQEDIIEDSVDDKEWIKHYEALLKEGEEASHQTLENVLDRAEEKYIRLKNTKKIIPDTAMYSNGKGLVIEK